MKGVVNAPPTTIPGTDVVAPSVKRTILEFPGSRLETAMAPAPADTPRANDKPATTPQELVQLAQSYFEASEKFLRPCKKADKKAKKSPHQTLAHAPYRFNAIHAIELYLSAYLQLNKHEPQEIRDLQDNLEERTTRATKAGLVLRKRTISHLGKLTSTREYVETRYHPAALKKLSQPTQLLATLNDVRQKVEKAVTA
jgi:hypothetical protein